MKPAIIVHGGCFNIPASFRTLYMQGTTDAAQAGYDVLLKGGSSVDAVSAAVSTLEDLPQFNAGTGSCLTRDGTVEMDAFIMNGKDLTTGAVCSVSRIKNPVLLARAVMEKSSHCLISGNGAEEFAESQGIPVLEDTSVLQTKEAHLKSIFSGCVDFDSHVLAQHNLSFDAETVEDLDDMTMSIAKKKARMSGTPGEDSHDTVGAVAIDKDGNVACATSTGGIPGKLPGRVGDTPLIGCGGYANKFGGASSTGHGEAIMRAMTCAQTVFDLEHGYEPSLAAERAVDDTFAKTQGKSGIICINSKGQVGLYFLRGSRMAWASIDSNGLRFGIDEDDVRTDLADMNEN